MAMRPSRFASCLERLFMEFMLQTQRCAANDYFAVIAESHRTVERPIVLAPSLA